MATTEKIHFTCDERNHKAIGVKETLITNYGQNTFEDADVIVALGGDGFMLHTLHKAMSHDKPVFGLNFGHHGFLMNTFDGSALKKRIDEAISVKLSPLKMTSQYCQEKDGKFQETYYALNEVSLLRQLHQAARLQISVEGQIRLKELTCDGLIVSTATGSTAYNFSANGPILPLTSNLVALTPISAFRPRRWSGALLPDDTFITITVLESEKRPVSVTADYQEVRNICSVRIQKAKSKSVTILYDSHQSLADRLIDEQFAY